MLGIDIRHMKDLREDHDLNQKELAKILNLSQRSYSHYENGTRKIPLDILVALADFYGCSTDYLLGRTKGKRKPPLRLHRTGMAIPYSCHACIFPQSDFSYCFLFHQSQP